VQRIALSFPDRAECIFQSNHFSNPEAFQMIFEILAVIFLIQCGNMIGRFIGRRRDVFYYLSKPNPYSDLR
jgi:hypothetical protein